MTRRMLTSVLALFLVAALALPAVAHGRGPFSDVEDHWARRQIALLKAAGILQGIGNGLFCPEGQMTRAEVAAMLLRMLGLEGEAEGEMAGQGGGAPPFADFMQAPAWSRNHIRVCFEHRLMLGELEGNGRFCNPNKPIPRQEFVVLLTRALDEEDARDLEAMAQELMADFEELRCFHDYEAIGKWAAGYILLALQEGWVQGYEDGTFRPNKPVTRAEAAAFAERLEAYLGCRWTSRYVGTIVSADTTANTITILTEGDEDEGEPGEDLTFTLGDECLIYVSNQPSELGALEPGWEVKVFVQDGLAVFIKASPTSPATP